MVHRHFTAYANGPAVPGRGQLPARPRKVLHAGPFEAEGLLVHFPPTCVGNPNTNVLQQVCCIFLFIKLYLKKLFFYKFVRNVFVIPSLHIMYLSIYLNTFYIKNFFLILLTVILAHNLSVIKANKV